MTLLLRNARKAWRGTPILFTSSMTSIRFSMVTPSMTLCAILHTRASSPSPTCERAARTPWPCPRSCGTPAPGPGGDRGEPAGLDHLRIAADRADDEIAEFADALAQRGRSFHGNGRRAVDEHGGHAAFCGERAVLAEIDLIGDPCRSRPSRTARRRPRGRPPCRRPCRRACRAARPFPACGSRSRRRPALSRRSAIG